MKKPRKMDGWPTCHGYFQEGDLENDTLSYIQFFVVKNAIHTIERCDEDAPAP